MTLPSHPDAPNFRELGGIPLSHGRRVRSGRFYRCASPWTFAPPAMEAMERLNPYAVVDFRGVEEAAAKPYTLPGAIRDRRVAMPVEPKTGERVRALAAEGRLTPETAQEAMRETYRYYSDENHGLFAEFLRLVQEADGQPVVWHCAAGKDRTGFGAALILSALEADIEVIHADYMISNELWRPPVDPNSAVPEIAREALRSVHPSFLDAALMSLEAAHGSARDFAVAALGGEEKHRAFAEASTEPA